MKLKLQVVEAQGTGSWADVTEHGSLRSQLVKTDILSFSQKNLESEKRVVILIKEKGDGAPKMLSLSERLSNWVRKNLKAGRGKIELMKSLLVANVIENEDGNFFLVTKGTLAEGWGIDALDNEEVKEVTFEEMI